MKLLGSKILIQAEAAEEKTASGLVLPSNVQSSKIKTGKVIEVGLGDRNNNGERIEMDVKVGDKVLYNHTDYGTSEIELDKTKYFLIEERDVIGIL